MAVLEVKKIEKRDNWMNIKFTEKQQQCALHLALKEFEKPISNRRRKTELNSFIKFFSKSILSESFKVKQYKKKPKLNICVPMTYAPNFK